MAYEVIRTLTVTFSYGAYAGILLVASGRAGEGWGRGLNLHTLTVTSLGVYRNGISRSRAGRGGAPRRAEEIDCAGELVDCVL
jgi:hypothetical protein